MKLKDAKEQVEREHPDWSTDQKSRAIQELLHRVDPASHSARWDACQAEVAAAHPELTGRQLKKAIMAEWHSRSDARATENRAKTKAEAVVRYRAEEGAPKDGLRFTDLCELVDKGRESGVDPSTAVLGDTRLYKSTGGRKGYHLRFLEV